MLQPCFTSPIKPSFLRMVANKKFYQGYTTIELMAQAKSECERRMVAAVSLFEVKHGELFTGMNEQEVGFVKGCHEIVRQFFDDYTAAAIPCRVVD